MANKIDKKKCAGAYGSNGTLYFSIATIAK